MRGVSATVTTNKQARTQKTCAWAMPGCWLRARTAETTETQVIEPVWRKVARSPEIAATSVGASASVALFAAGATQP